jgi:hypothetical protein
MVWARSVEDMIGSEQGFRCRLISNGARACHLIYVVDPSNGLA